MLRIAYSSPWLAALVLGALLAGALSGVASAGAPPGPSPALATHPTILIEGDSGFTPANGVVSGTGSESRPYIIEGLDIAASSAPGIVVRNTDAFFVVRDVRVHGGGWVYSGIYLNNVANGTFVNVTVDGNYEGIGVDVSRDVRINASAVSSNNGFGIAVRSSTRVEVSGTSLEVNQAGIVVRDSSSLDLQWNYLRGNLQNAISFDYTSGIRFEGNWVEELGNGISLWNLGASTFVGNTFDSIRDLDLWLVDSSGINVSGNTIRFRSGGLRIVGVDGLELIGNLIVSESNAAIISGRNIRVEANEIWAGGGRGLSIESAEAVRVVGNDLRNPLYGLGLFQVTNATVRANDFSGNGITLSGDAPAHYDSHAIAPDNTVDGRPIDYRKGCADLALEGVQAGQLILASCSRVRVSNASIGGTEIGLQAAFVDGLDLGNLTLSGSSLFGLFLHNVTGGTMVGLSASSNSRAGVYVRASVNLVFDGLLSRSNGVGVALGGSSDILVKRSRFVDNGVQATDDRGSANAWDAGYPEGGNVWSDYAGWDDCGGPAQDVCTGSDGLGDTWYVIDADTYDRYPIVEVNPPNAPPEPVIVGPTRGVAYDTIHWDGTSSFDPDGQIVSYRWEFGDGDQSTGSTAYHRYTTAGTYDVRLTVTDNRHTTTTARVLVMIEPPPEIPLVLYEHASGFRLPIPADWSRSEDEPSDGDVTELVLTGTYRGTPASILVDMGTDETVRETDAHLLDLANQVVAEIRASDPTAYLVDGPDIRRISNHSAVVFVLGYGTGQLFQKVAIVVSEPHDRYWLLVLTALPSQFEVLDLTFEAMLAGFEITLPPPPSPGPANVVLLGVIGALASAGIVAGVVAFLTIRRRRIGTLPVGIRPEAGPPVSAPAQRGASEPPQLAPSPAAASSLACLKCAAPQPAPGRFCVRCGSPMTSR